MLLAALTLGGMFSDHLVLQRERTNPLWGRDDARQVVTLHVEGVEPQPAPVSVTVGPDGTWRLWCPELPVGGPYRLRIVGSTEQVLDDVLVGDVWLASGQSNMEFPLAGARDAARELAAANHPEIRVVKIPRRATRTPATDVEAGWMVCRPDQAGAFTAVGYFFAREVHAATGVPVGIIDATWGGTRLEAWISREGLRPVWPEVDAELERIAARDADLPAILAAYRRQAEAWERASFPQDEENRGEQAGWDEPGFDDSDWQRMTVPSVMQREGFEGNGAAWFRREVTVPPGWAGEDLTLRLGAIDDFDTTYFNGERVGETGPETFDAYQVPRYYRVPGRLVRGGRNVLAVRVFDRYGEGGLTGPAVQMTLGRTGHGGEMALAGDWAWKVERAVPRVSPDVYRHAPAQPPELAIHNAPAHLFNGMIAPVAGYGLRGFLWYQGESNVGAHLQYAVRFPALIRDWRRRWGAGTLPFYFVQLAGFRQSASWPFLREAQTYALREPETGMAVAIDVGDPLDIHPTNKQAVGHRLALLARVHAYGESDLLAQGPRVEAVRIEGAAVHLLYGPEQRLRTSDGGTKVRAFELAGADGIYHPAEAVIDGRRVVAQAAAVPRPQSVRYAWKDYAEVNLENAAGLPAEPFRMDAQGLALAE